MRRNKLGDLALRRPLLIAFAAGVVAGMTAVIDFRDYRAALLGCAAMTSITYALWRVGGPLSRRYAQLYRSDEDSTHEGDPFGRGSA